MGYFPNGSSFDAFEEDLCSRCLHHQDCAVLDAHLLKNYDECNNADSILHILIPQTKDKLGNEKCRMFLLDPNADAPGQAKLFEE